MCAKNQFSDLHIFSVLNPLGVYVVIALFTNHMAHLPFSFIPVDEFLL